MPTAPATDELALRRARARRTALWIAGVAIAVYVGFLLINILAR